MPDPDRGPDPALAAQRVIESAVQLTRAEVGLALARGRVLAVKMMSVILAVILAVAAAQVAVVLLALSPMLYQGNGWSAVLFALVPVLSLTGLGVYVALTAWNAFRNAAAAVAARGQS